MSQTAYWAFALLLSAATSAQADGAAASVELSPCQFDDDGLSRPLDQLKFDPGLGQREFGRATLDALNVYDPWESWNHRVCYFDYRSDERAFLPAARGYEYITPHSVRSGVNNLFDSFGGVPSPLNNLA